MALSIPKQINYASKKPCGKCKVCTINLWSEHGNKPAPIAMPCGLDNCPHQTSAEVIKIEYSPLGSSLAMITG